MFVEDRQDPQRLATLRGIRNEVPGPARWSGLVRASVGLILLSLGCEVAREEDFPTIMKFIVQDFKAVSADLAPQLTFHGADTPHRIYEFCRPVVEADAGYEPEKNTWWWSRSTPEWPSPVGTSCQSENCLKPLAIPEKFSGRLLPLCSSLCHGAQPSVRRSQPQPGRRTCYAQNQRSCRSTPDQSCGSRNCGRPRAGAKPVFFISEIRCHLTTLVR